MGDFGTWGWGGRARRGLIIPAGSAVSVSPRGRAKIRYNEVTKTVQVSLDGSGYVDLSGPASSASVVTVSSVGDLPSPAAGVYTLDANKVYLVTDLVNLGANRIDVNGSSLIGLSRRATGFSTNNAQSLLLGSVGAEVESLLLINPAGPGFDFTGGIVRLIESRFEGCASAGRLGDADRAQINRNVLEDTLAGFLVDGDVTQFDCSGNSFLVPAGAPSFVAVDFTANCQSQAAQCISNDVTSANASDIAFRVDAAATFGVSPAEFELNTFIGPGTPVVGTNPGDPRTEFRGNQRIVDSVTVGGMNFALNTTATVIPAVDTYVVIGNGQTSPPHVPFTLNPESQRFSVVGAFPNQRLRYDGLISVRCSVSFGASITRSGGGTPVGRLAVFKNGVIDSLSVAEQTLGNVQTRFASAALLSLSTGDEIDLRVANGTNSDNVIVNSAFLTPSRAY